jgi:hypothetical protein
MTKNENDITKISPITSYDQNEEQIKVISHEQR